MIRVINEHNRHRFEHSLDQNFRLRHEIFVKERGWTDFDRGAYETDQYDNNNTIYVLSLDERKNVVGGFRLYPTILPHMISDQFSYMVEGAIPERNDVFELTRFSISKNHRGSKVYHELFLGLLEYCLGQGILGATTLMRTLRIPVIQSIGISAIPLGLSQEIDGDMNTVALIEISEESLTRVRKSAGVFTSVLEQEWQEKRQVAYSAAFNA